MYNISEIDLAEFTRIRTLEGMISSAYVTPEWLTFLMSEENRKPVLLKIEDERGLVAAFAGMLIRKLGVKICGSPFEQWGTFNMGFVSGKDVKREELIEPVSMFVKKRWHCGYMEIIDEYLSFEQLANVKCALIRQKTPMLPIDCSDEALFKRFKTDCRNFIRQFERRGASITPVPPSEQFADEYYDQLIEVFAKQNLRPHNTRKSVHLLMKAFENNPENILCLRVTNPEGACIATSIFLGHDEYAYFWGAASFREHQHYRPNEYMIWTAIRYWRARGVKYLNMCGPRQYKMKFGPDMVEYPRIVITTSKILLIGRNMAKKAIKQLRVLRGK